MSEIIFEVQEDEIDGGYVATALGHGIVTQGDTLEELREMVCKPQPLQHAAAALQALLPQ